MSRNSRYSDRSWSVGQMTPIAHPTDFREGAGAKVEPIYLEITELQVKDVPVVKILATLILLGGLGLLILFLLLVLCPPAHGKYLC